MEQIVAQLVSAHTAVSGILKCKEHTAISVSAVGSMLEGITEVIAEGEVKEELKLLIKELEDAFAKVSNNAQTIVKLMNDIRFVRGCNGVYYRYSYNDTIKMLKDHYDTRKIVLSNDALITRDIKQAFICKVSSKDLINVISLGSVIPLYRETFIPDKQKIRQISKLLTNE